MDENREMWIKEVKVDKLCGNNMVGIIKTVTLMKSKFEFLKIYVYQMEGTFEQGNFRKILTICRIIDDLRIEVF